MKSLIILAAISCFFTASVIAQHSGTHDAHTHNNATTDNQSSTSKLLVAYYGVKNALVASNAASTATKAATFSTALKAVDVNTLSGVEKSTFSSLKDNLATDADKIAASKNIADQRTHFANFSLNMWELVNAAGSSTQPVYQQYCPMKKAYWLSSEKEIKNPYYGKQMLTCGKISATHTN